MFSQGIEENHNTGRRDFHMVMKSQDTFANVSETTGRTVASATHGSNPTHPTHPTHPTNLETKTNRTHSHGTNTNETKHASKEPWRTWFANTGGPKQIQQPPIPEPEFPRIAPTGTGISLRPSDIPPASLENIRNACHFYELKSSGKYSSKTLAGRYIFQLSREVQRQIVALEKASLAKMRRIEYLEDLVRNWENTFGKPSDEDLEKVFNLKGHYSQILSPIRLASLLRNRLSENESLTEKMNEMLKTRQDDVDRAEKAIGDHFKATREQFRRDSERLNGDVLREKTRIQKQQEEEQLQNDKNLAALTNTIHDAANASLAKERSEINLVVARKVKEGLKKAMQTSNQAIVHTENERRNHATAYLRKLNKIQQREQMIDGRLLGQKDRHSKEVASLKARYARMLKETTEQVANNNQRNEHVVVELETENRWLRQRVADLQEMVVAFQDAMALS